MLIDLSAAAPAGSAAEGYLYMALGGLAWLAWYAFACWRWPFRACPRCKGTGRRPSPSGRTFRMCKRCGGSAKRLRIARVVFNYFANKRKDAS